MSIQRTGGAVANKFDESRTILAGFGAYYETEITPQLASCGERHWVLKRRQIRALVVGALALVAAILGALTTRIITIEDPLDVMGLIFIFLFGMILIYAFSNGELFQSSERVDGLITKEICKFLGFHHKASGDDFPFSVFLEAHIVPFHDEIDLKDRIAGRHQGIDFAICQARLTRSGGDETTVIFRGMLLLLRFHKSFHGKTVIKRNRGSVINSFRPTGHLERVELEYPAFAERFATYSTDQLESRYILTPAFMERVVALTAVYGDEAIEAAFVRGQLLLSINFGVEIHEEFHDFLTADDPKRTQLLLDRICIVTDVIDALQLSSKTVV